MSDTNNKLTIPHPADRKQNQTAKAAEGQLAAELSPWQLAKMAMVKLGVLSLEDSHGLTVLDFVMHCLAWVMLYSMFILKWGWVGVFVPLALMCLLARSKQEEKP